MALSPRRCIPLRTLCRGWTPVGAGHVLTRQPFGKDSSLTLFPRLGLRSLPISSSRLQQYRLLSDVKPPKVNVSLSLIHLCYWLELTVSTDHRRQV
jgi:hypothetical protein